MKKSWRIALAALLVSGGAAIWGWTSAGESLAGQALAEFRVANLSCGSCVGNIRETLDPVAGIGSVDVNLTTGRARVEFDDGRIAPEQIAERITRAGYPAELAHVLSPADYRSLREDRARLSEKFVARVGERLISREEFTSRVAALEGDPRAASRGLLRSAWEQLVQRELLLAAAGAQGVLVQDGEVDRELALLKREDASPRFRADLKERMIINRLVEDYVLSGETEPHRRRATLESWYRELQAATPVEIFDPALRAATGKTGGCGGCC